MATLFSVSTTINGKHDRSRNVIGHDANSYTSDIGAPPRILPIIVKKGL